MNILDLPHDVILHIFRHLHFLDIAGGVRLTCKSWNHLSHEGSLWREIKLHQTTLPESSFINFISSVAADVESLHFLNTSYLEHTYLHQGILCERLKQLYFHHTGPVVETYVEVIQNLIAKYPNLQSVSCELNISNSPKECLLPFASLKSLESFKICVDEEFTAKRSQQEEALIEIFRNCMSLTSVCIRGFSVSDDVLGVLLKERRGLKSLDLANCYGFSDCAFFEDESLILEDLVRLNLSNTAINDKGLRLLSSHAPYLKFVSLLSCQWTTDVGLAHIAHNCRSLSSLLINTDRYVKSNITNSGLQSVAVQCPKLQKIFINYCSEVNDTGVISIAEGCPDLRELLIEGCTALTDASILTLSKHCPNLSVLILSECVQLTSQSISILVSRCRHLQELDLRTCHRLSGLNFEDVTKPNHTFDIARDAENQSTQSTAQPDRIVVEKKNSELFETGNSSSENPRTEVLADEERAGTSDVVLEQTTQLSISNSSESRFTIHSHLRVLNLGFCSQISNNSVLQIAKHCRDLVDLSLEGCANVTDEGIDCLTKKCKFLRILNISGGSLFKASSLTNNALFSVGKYSQRLEKLKVWKNSAITADGIVKVIEGCPSIASITVSYGSRTGLTVNSLTSEFQSVPQKMFKIKKQTAHLLGLYIYPNKEFSIGQ